MLGLVLQAAAITLVFTQGSIFDWFRAHGPAWWRTLAGCPLCAGVWIGAAWYVLDARVLAGDWHFAWEYVLVQAFAAGVLTAVLALTIARVWDALERVAEPGP